MYAASRIEQYLRDHPDGDLLIAVGYATAAGMAWLAQRTAGRRVSLLIGDTRSQYWNKVPEPDRATCLAFMHRPDVEIRNWYRTKRSHSGESAAHLKVWAMHDNWSPMSALVGSGNLTRKGLDSALARLAAAPGAWERRGHGRSTRQRNAAGMGHRSRPLGEGLAVRRPADQMSLRVNVGRWVVEGP